MASTPPEGFVRADEWLDGGDDPVIGDSFAQKAAEAGFPTSNPQGESSEDGAAHDSILDSAGDVVNDRENKHGTAEETHRRIGRLWEAYLDLPAGTIEAHDAAVMLDQLKDARIRENPTRRENWVDKAGYAECGYRCASAGDETETSQILADGRIVNQEKTTRADGGRDLGVEGDVGVPEIRAVGQSDPDAADYWRARTDPTDFDNADDYLDALGWETTLDGDD